MTTKWKKHQLLILLGTNQWNKRQLLLLLEQIKIIVHKKVKKADRKPEKKSLCLYHGPKHLTM